ncbi:MAG TPA: ATP-binding protein [Dokdonella sp.]|uniref:ATP-binding protein n=1 Tax=Dokdonella sp. TaxID=2291710 RepID=UPI002D80099F|nr:ATP-binding protein [Dokdonella sp.]HET9034271.1 ATP-binding protein [Dokdonella sp.]
MAKRGNQRVKLNRPVRRWRYRVKTERAAIGRFADRMDEDLDTAGIDESVRQSLATVLDELLANVVMHAQAVRGPVHVRLRCSNDELIARLRYCAVAFDPTVIAATHLPTTVASANIGGVGIAMVRAMTREFSHQYRRGENHLRVRLPLKTS